MPVLLLHSVVDHVVEPVNAAVIAESISSTDITDVLLERSFHVATLDYDADVIHERSRAFLPRVTGVTV